jgi:hypothetical protein
VPLAKNLKVLAAFLIEGFVAGTWRIQRKAKAATLFIEPFDPLSDAMRDAIAAEGRQSG